MFLDLYNDIHDLVKYESDGIKSSTRDSELEDSDAPGGVAGAGAPINHAGTRK